MKLLEAPALDIYRQISFKLGMLSDTSALYILIPLCLNLMFIQDHNRIRKQNLLHSFSDIFNGFVELYSDALTCLFAEAHAKFHAIDIQGR